MKPVCLPLNSPDCTELFSTRPDAEGTIAWYRTLASQTLEADEEPFVAAVESPDGSRAAIALVRRGNGTLRGLTAPYTTRFSPAAGTQAGALALGEAVAGLVSDRVDLDAIEDSEICTAFVEGLRQSRLVSAGFRHFANWYEDIESFDGYWSGRPKRLRETVRRKLNRLKGAKFHLLRTPQELARGAAVYGEIYAQSGKCAEPHPRFMAELIDRLGSQDQVRLGLLTLGDQAIAAQVWLVQDRSATIFKLAHRAEFSTYSPGTVLTYRMLSFLIPAQGLTRVDFGRGDDSYKRDWLGSRNYRKGIIACNPGSLSGLRNIVTSILPTWTGAIVRSRRPLFRGRVPNRASCISIADSGRTSRATESIMSA